MQIRKDRTTFAADHSHAAAWGFLVLMPLLMAALWAIGLTKPEPDATPASFVSEVTE